MKLLMLTKPLEAKFQSVDSFPTIPSTTEVWVRDHNGWCDLCRDFHDEYCPWSVVEAVALLNAVTAYDGEES